MSNYSDENRGVLFRNDKKETEKHPDYTGKIDVNGKEFRLAAWIRESKAGTKFMSLAVSEFQDGSSAGTRETPKHEPDLDSLLDDAIPF